MSCHVYLKLANPNHQWAFSAMRLHIWCSQWQDCIIADIVGILDKWYHKRNVNKSGVMDCPAYERTLRCYNIHWEVWGEQGNFLRFLIKKSDFCFEAKMQISHVRVEFKYCFRPWLDWGGGNLNQIRRQIWSKTGKEFTKNWKLSTKYKIQIWSKTGKEFTKKWKLPTRYKISANLDCQIDVE